MTNSKTDISHLWQHTILSLVMLPPKIKLSRTDTTRNVGHAQCDGRPAEYRWRPLFNAAKFGWRPLLECRAVTLPRRETRWNFAWVPQTRQQISAASRPKFTILWRHVEEISMFNKFFFRFVDTCFSCEDTARQSCAMVPKWRFFVSCIFSQPRAAHFTHAF